MNTSSGSFLDKSYGSAYRSTCEDNLDNEEVEDQQSDVEDCADDALKLNKSRDIDYKASEQSISAQTSPFVNTSPSSARRLHNMSPKYVRTSFDQGEEESPYVQDQGALLSNSDSGSGIKYDSHPQSTPTLRGQFGTDSSLSGRKSIHEKKSSNSLYPHLNDLMLASPENIQVSGEKVTHSFFSQEKPTFRKTTSGVNYQRSSQETRTTSKESSGIRYDNRQQSTPNHDQRRRTKAIKDDQSIPWGLIIILIIVAVFVYALWFKKDSSNKKNSNSEGKSNQVLDKFLEMFDELDSSFPSQTNTLWKILRSGTRAIIVPELPIQPAVFILVVPRGAEETAQCIVRKYADIVTDVFGGRPPIHFTHHLRTADTPEHVKEVIDDTLSHGFLEGSRVAIIHELNKLHGESVLMFYGYCDNENAPFTQVAFVFTLYLDSVNEESDEFVEKKLAQIWGSYLDSDTLFPLLSRIGNQNAFVRQESREVLTTNNCL